MRPEHLYKAVLLAFVLALAFRFFDTLSRVLLIAYGAVILAIALNVIVRRIPLKRTLATSLIAVVAVLATMAGLWIGGRALAGQLTNLVGNLPAMETMLRERASGLSERLGFDVEAIGERAGAMLRDMGSDLSGRDLLGEAGGVLEWLVVPLLVFFGGVFALARPNDRLLVPLLRAVPDEKRPAYRRMFERLGERLTGWVGGQLIAMACVGILATVTFYLIGVPYALLLGVINAFTEFVPLVGPWIGGLPAVVVAFIDEPSKGLWTALAIIAIQQIESQIITPLVMSRTTSVPPFVTLFSLVLFGGMFGFLGVVLAVPLVILFWALIETLWVERALDAGDDAIAPVVEE